MHQYTNTGRNINTVRFDISTMNGVNTFPVASRKFCSQSRKSISIYYYFLLAASLIP